MDTPRVGGRGGIRPLAHRKGPHPVAREINRKGLIPRNDDLAHPACNDAPVCGAGRNERRQSSLAKGDVAFIDDLRIRITRLVELVDPGHEIGVVDIRRRRDQRADVDDGARMECHAMLVDDPDIPVCRQLPANVGRQVIQDAV